MPDELMALAHAVRDRAYAPYSGYRVGAALRTPSGATFVGCNVENLSFGATICAERMAVGAMVAAGETQVAEVAVVTLDGAPPCGLCLQVLAEFVPDLAACRVASLALKSGETTVWTLSELLPYHFQSDQVRRTDAGSGGV